MRAGRRVGGSVNKIWVGGGECGQADANVGKRDDGAGGAYHQKRPMAAQLRLPPVTISRGDDEEYDGGDDRRSLAVGWPKSGKIASGCCDVAFIDYDHGEGRRWS